MNMATKPRSERETVMTVRLPRELHEYLKKAAQAGEGGIAAELRHRLEASFVSSLRTGDQKTADFVDAIATVAVNVQPPYGPWHENPHAFAVFSAAMTALLAYFR